MRRFKFIGDPKEYTSKGDPSPFIVGNIYNFDFIGLGCVFPISEYISFIGDRDWQEVFEEPTLQDRIQELKDFAKGQGLKVDVVVEDIDILEGVEFAESLYNLDCGDGKFTKRKIYLINSIGNKTLTFKFDDNCNPINASSKSFFKPSTQSAYVEQLKKEAFERFGEIKEGHTFTDEEVGFIRSCNKALPDFSYSKDNDILFAFGARVYKQGKWAKKLPKRVEVEFNHHIAVGNFSHHTHSFSLDIPRDSSQFEPIKAGKFLAKQLEKYLNGEV